MSTKPRTKAQAPVVAPPAQVAAEVAPKAPIAKVDPLEEAISKLETPGVKVEREEAKLARGGKTERMLYSLASQPKIRTLIPLSGKERRGSAVHTACVNGLRLVFLKGVFIDLPQQVAELVEAGFQGATTAGDAWDINRDKTEKGVHISTALG